MTSNIFSNLNNKNKMKYFKRKLTPQRIRLFLSHSSLKYMPLKKKKTHHIEDKKLDWNPDLH